MNYLEEQQGEINSHFLCYDMRCEHYVRSRKTGITPNPHTPQAHTKQTPVRIVSVLRQSEILAHRQHSCTAAACIGHMVIKCRCLVSAGTITGVHNL